jgi:hypothetical protein
MIIANEGFSEARLLEGYNEGVDGGGHVERATVIRRFLILTGCSSIKPSFMVRAHIAALTG